MAKFYSLCLGIVFIFLGNYLCSAQTAILENTDSLKYYLKKQKFEIDKDASAIILYEKGNSLLQNGILTYKVEKVIKILKQSSVSEVGMVAIPASSKTQVKKVVGITYNLNDHLIEEQKIEKADIIKDKITESLSTLKFNFPALKEGSIIYYSYTLEYRSYSFIPEWYFQHSIPTLFSIYEVSMPDNVYYTEASRVSIPFEKVKKIADLDQKESATFNVIHRGTKTESTTWVRRNLPALKEEVFRRGENHYLDRVKIFFTGYNSSWDKMSELLVKNAPSFNQMYGSNSFLNLKVKELIQGETNDLEKAKTLYCFVRDSFILSDINNDEGSIHLKRTFNNRKGTLLELNQVLIAMMLKADLNAALVLLSSKPREPLNPLIANFNHVNYALTKLEIDGMNYVMDPSQKYLPFGLLLPESYNGYSRVLSKKYGEIYLDDNLLKDKIIVAVALKLNPEENKMVLTMDKKLNDVTAFQYRDKWKGDERKAILELKEEYTSEHFNIDHISVKNISDPEKELRIHMEASAQLDNQQKFIFNAYTEKLFKTNPLPATERKYPIAFPYQYNHNYFFHLQLPEGYSVEYLPESKQFAQAQDKLFFSSLLTIDENKRNVTLNSKFETKQNFFDPSEYEQMRTFFDALILEQNQNIIIKKDI